MARFIPTRSDLLALEFTILFYELVKLKYRLPRGVVSNRDIRITLKF